tara:strand:+ start:4707 stop:5162 length:456 start_codon:yes stop_codon:yes gene_type:complete
MEAFDQLGMDFADMIGPWIAILVSISAAFWFKDFATNFMQGLKFRFNPAWSEGDEVLLEGEQALIVKIGLRETVFGTYGTNGYTWRYVPNERIQFLKLEKIINKDLHLDSDIEKGRRIQSLIDRAQDAYIKQNEEGIARNKEDIENLKKGN